MTYIVGMPNGWWLRGTGFVMERDLATRFSTVAEAQVAIHRAQQLNPRNKGWRVVRDAEG